MDKLEFQILEILKRGTPLRAVKIAEMLGVERREVNHYLYSSLKNMVVQDSEYKWSFQTNKIGNNQRIQSQPQKSQTKSPIPVQQDTSYSFTKKEIKQDTPIQPPISPIPSSQPAKYEKLERFSQKYFEPKSPTPSSQPVRQSNPFEVVRRELAQVSSEQKVKILENAFRQDRFSELEDEQINALQSILEEAKREVNIVNTAYTQGKLGSWKANRLAIAAVSITLALTTFFVINQLRFSQTYQPTPTIPQNR
ncbi:hypothetical protein FNW02_20365 [Komarekiella sp. 'clone 1']|uniref:Uncharacterized protein n=1 Tax=Komarekiella delphini-convector SJRDD-AB1 TaxID=2593771 RepID=A0AA40SZH2_9NOST|nr:hypothetical protein [Komarekiella delphini-convector]MBD6618113.1 hypothetical protein [Komarekiella delphini-convector SJRDD-AB1]